MKNRNILQYCLLLLIVVVLFFVIELTRITSNSHFAPSTQVQTLLLPEEDFVTPSTYFNGKLYILGAKVSFEGSEKVIDLFLLGKGEIVKVNLTIAKEALLSSIEVLNYNLRVVSKENEKQDCQIRKETID